MKPETILQALSETRPALLDEARESVPAKPQKLRPLRRIALAAAAIALLAATVYAGSNLLPATVPAAEVHNPGGFDMHWQEKTARKMMGDGWVFSFTQYENKNGDDSGLCRYQFSGVNLRHRYDEAYVQAELHVGEDPNPILIRYEDYLKDPAQVSGDGVRVDVYVPRYLTWGMGSAAQARDMEKIEAILTDDREPEDLLALDPADYEFESFDKELFFGLMREALTGSPHEERTDLKYWNHEAVNVLAEPAKADGYRFQVGWLMTSGCVDELYLDVLYQTGEGDRDYVQLSDLVEADEAAPEQREAFNLLLTVAERVKSEEHFLAGAELYRDKTVAGLDFNRLLRFMTELHEGKELSDCWNIDN